MIRIASTYLQVNAIIDIVIVSVEVCLSSFGCTE
jgi:hypothetical protein